MFRRVGFHAVNAGGTLKLVDAVGAETFENGGVGVMRSHRSESTHSTTMGLTA